MLWHQVTNSTANSSIAGVLSKINGVNVISPTWFAITGEDGGISDIASMDYVNSCHNRGIQVWGLVSDFENDIDVGRVLSVTSSRDNLVNNILGKALSTSMIFTSYLMRCSYKLSPHANKNIITYGNFRIIVSSGIEPTIMIY